MPELFQLLVNQFNFGQNWGLNVSNICKRDQSSNLSAEKWANEPATGACPTQLIGLLDFYFKKIKQRNL